MGLKGWSGKELHWAYFLYKRGAIDSHSHDGSSFVCSEGRRFNVHEILFIIFRDTVAAALVLSHSPLTGLEQPGGGRHGPGPPPWGLS